MSPLTGRQRKYLRGLAHHLQPVVMVGRKGLSESVVATVDEALEQHELIKVRLLDFADRAAKDDAAARLAELTAAEPAGRVGNLVILYRPARDPERRRIVVEE
ncbi:MAG: ribosome assembly RNA-binding protein YhbY [Deltaproteobacteria bacterium]|nr:ribosome assembly RNA-binding protein YhbY [Candidatus Anaeroferrophillacea bacterium]